MSCDCFRKKYFQYDKVKELASKMAAMEDRAYYIFRKKDGTFDFAPFTGSRDEIFLSIEFVSPMRSLETV